MTVAALNAYDGPYLANGATTAFPFTFDAGSTSEVGVTLDGAEQVAGFTVTLNAGGNGGTVTFAVAPAIGVEVIPFLDPSFAQDISFTNAGPFLPKTVTEALDRDARRAIYLKGRIESIPEIDIADEAQSARTAASAAILAATSANAAAADAEAAETQAGLFAAAAEAFAAGLYATTAAGIAATVDGDYFLVVGTGNTFASLYKNVAGVVTAQGLDIASLAAMAGVKAAIGYELDYIADTTVGSTAPTGAAVPDATNYFSSAAGGLADGGFLKSVSLQISAAGDFKLAVVSAGSAVLWEDTFSLPAIGIYTVYPVDVYMPAGSRLYYRKVSGGALTYQAGGVSSYFAAADYSGVIGDTVTENNNNPISVALSYVVSAPPGGSFSDRLAAAENAINAGGDTTEELVSNATATPAGLSLTTAITLSRNGVVTSASDTRAFAAAANVRYDVIYYDSVAGTFGVVAGTNRATDAPEYIPAIGAPSRIPLFNVRVTPAAVTAVPVWNIVNGEDRALAIALGIERNRSRACLRKTIQRIRRGQALKIVGLGDSITAIQSNAPSAATPNGTLRDMGAANGTPNTYLRDNLAADTVAAVPLYTAVQLGRADDGAGAVHTKIGFNWELVTALQADGYTLGADLTYDNFGIGGQASANAVAGAGLSAWGLAAAALGGHLVVVEFGMNELGGAGTEANLVIIALAFQAAGAEVLFMGVPFPRAGSVASWEYTNRAIQRAARYTNSAWVPTMPLYDAAHIGAIGLSTADTCTANANNHPGLLEHRALGRELVKTVLD